MNTIRVLVFGATGTGKTSLCNALTGQSRPSDSGAIGVTAKSHLYAPFRHGEYRIEVIDTVGLHESSHGTVPAEQAVVDLVTLLEKARDGFSILIHVARASRITADHDADHEFFVHKMTQSRIPVLLAVTGCENEVPMSAWVDRNQAAFKRFSYRRIIPTCFASGGPMENHFAPLRHASVDSLLDAVIAIALPNPHRLYGAGTGSTFDQTLGRIWNDLVTLAGFPEHYRRKVNESAFSFMKRIGVSDALANAAIRHVPDLLGELAGKMPIPGSGAVVRNIARALLEKLRNKPAP